MSLLPREGPDRCPDCGGTNLLVGNFPLNCLTCGWNYLNKHPCRVCGGKSVSSVCGSGKFLYGCKDHPITPGEMNELVSGFANAILGKESA